MTAANITSRETAVEAAVSARARGLDWMLARIDASGRPSTDPRGVFRVPWALAVAGQQETAAKVLAWAARELLTSSGDMAEGTMRERFRDSVASYPLAILAMGAWHLDRYDIARKIMDTLADYQNPATGGAYSQAPEARTSDPVEDLFPTAQLGMTAVCTGRTEMAAGAYRWFTDLWAAQPEPPGRLYRRTCHGALITDVEKSGDPFMTVTDLHGERQAFYNPGIAAAFLGRYHLATGDSEALALADRYLSLSATGGPAQFDYAESRQICKFGWGAAVLSEADPGNAAYEDYILRMAHWFADCQESDGRWHNSPFLNSSPTDDEDMEITAEFVQHLSYILLALAERTALPQNTAADLAGPAA
jgi:hypothetical protein